MGSYSIDNATAVQGRYADIVTTSQNTQGKDKVWKDAVSKTVSAYKDRDFLPEGVIPKIGSSEEMQSGFNEEKKSKYEDIVKDEIKMNSITETLNELMAELSAQVKFSVHKETSFLTVKFIDMQSNKVLKEFPAEEYLDMIAQIRKFIGAMVDEKV